MVGPGTFETRIIGGRYRVGPLLGRGSMGAVYRAHHVLTDQAVALKLINPSYGHPELVEARFRREVSVSAHVGHEGIVRVFDAGREADGSLYLAMELLDGETFAERAAREGFTAGYGLNVVRALLEPLAAAHALGIVHRDIKPENVFLHRRGDGREQVKLLDFGIARDPRHLSNTRTDVGLGTPFYMSPEQATNARAVTPASDVWAVGVLLYWLLSGKLPFESDTPFNTLSLVCTAAPDPLPPPSGRTGRALTDLVDRALDKAPAGRPKDAAALLRALDSALGPGPADSFSQVRCASSPELRRPWPAPAPAGRSDEAVVALAPVELDLGTDATPTDGEAAMASLSVGGYGGPSHTALRALAALLLLLVLGLAAKVYVDRRPRVVRLQAPRPAEIRPAASPPARPEPSAEADPAPAEAPPPEARSPAPPPPKPRPRRRRAASAKAALATADAASPPPAAPEPRPSAPATSAPAPELDPEPPPAPVDEPEPAAVTRPAEPVEVPSEVPPAPPDEPKRAPPDAGRAPAARTPPAKAPPDEVQPYLTF